MAIFQKRFGDRYKIVATPKWARLGACHFWMEKNPFIGVAVKLEQKPRQTKLRLNGGTTSPWAWLLAGGLSRLLLSKGLTNEVKSFVKEAPEFR
jgi:hypothetical protein